MKTELTTIDKVKQLLKIDVELATETLGEGKAVIEAAVFAEGEAVMIIEADGETMSEPLPVGEYELDNGMILVVVEEGIISEMKEKAEEGEEGEEPVAQNDNENEKPLPKAIIESVVKETKFSKEQMDAKDSEIEELKAKIVELEKVEEVEEEEEETKVELAVDNPEEAPKKKVQKIDRKNMTAEQIMMSSMANRK
jgi:hypothetical protein